MTKQHQRRRRPGFFAILLLIAGAAALIMGVTALLRTPDAYEYTLPMTNGSDAGSAASDLVKRMSSVEETLQGSVDVLAMAGMSQQVDVGSNESSAQATLYAVTEGWFEISPVFYVQGRPISEKELADGARTVLIDDGLAFTLFGGEVPEGAVLTMGSEEWTIAGVIRYTRGPGDGDDHVVYAPLRALIVQGDEEGSIVMAAPEVQTLTLMARPVGGGSFYLFQSAVSSAWHTGGSFYSLQKEALRGRMPARLLALLAGLWVLFTALRAANRLTARMIRDYRSALEREYAVTAMPRLVGIIAWCVFAYAAMLAALYALMVWSAQPLYVFTEWVPDNLVSWTSIVKVFRSLTGENARLVRAASPQIRRIEFWSRIVKAGSFALMCGGLLTLTRLIKSEGDAR